MPRVTILVLDDYQQITLEQMRDHHPKAYLRERAAALLKVAAGQSIEQVAATGLLRRREWETVASWVKRYERDGLGGLYLCPGRGRKPAFPP
jgi:transposase